MHKHNEYIIITTIILLVRWKFFFQRKSEKGRNRKGEANDIIFVYEVQISVRQISYYFYFFLFAQAHAVSNILNLKTF